MTYDIIFNAMTECGKSVYTIYLPHEPDDADKITRLRGEMITNGWQGRSVIMMDCGDFVKAFSGTHRICAAQGIDDLLEVVWLPEDLTSDEFDLIDAAYDDDELLAAFLGIAATRDDMTEVVEAMQAEVASNNDQLNSDGVKK